jgi:hypothetical protein
MTEVDNVTEALIYMYIYTAEVGVPLMNSANR